MANSSEESGMGSEENCTDYVETAAEVFSKLLQNPWPFAIVPAVGLTLLLITVAIYIDEVVFIVRHVPTTSRRFKVLVLTGMYPGICACCLLTIIFPRSSSLVDNVIAVYISFALYLFVSLITDYYGGTEMMLKVLDNKKASLRAPPCCCCCCCLPSVPVNSKNLTRMRGLVLQLAIIRPMLMFIATILVLDGVYVPGIMDFKSAYPYISIINICSTLAGIYGMGLIFRVAVPDLKMFLVGPKFACLQFVVLLVNAQPAILGILVTFKVIRCQPPFNSQRRSAAIYHVILFLEVFLLTIVKRFFYRRQTSDHLTVAEIKKSQSQANQNGMTNAYNGVTYL